jgi:hypothetical protein
MEDLMPKDGNKERPAVPPKDASSTAKVAQALKIREGAAAARKGKPLAFPTHRLRP